jgi:hypothetical protein
MARKLKTYQTSVGFFDLAIAAPSMKAALEAWSSSSNLFHRGAKEVDDPEVVAAKNAAGNNCLQLSEPKQDEPTSSAIKGWRRPLAGPSATRGGPSPPKRVALRNLVSGGLRAPSRHLDPALT